MGCACRKLGSIARADTPRGVHRVRPKCVHTISVRGAKGSGSCGPHSEVPTKATWRTAFFTTPQQSRTLAHCVPAWGGGDGGGGRRLAVMRRSAICLTQRLREFLTLAERKRGGRMPVLERSLPGSGMNCAQRGCVNSTCTPLRCSLRVGWLRPVRRRGARAPQWRYGSARGQPRPVGQQLTLPPAR
jgi:hypothetical protein